jgi:hypothetical protein
MTGATRATGHPTPAQAPTQTPAPPPAAQPAHPDTSTTSTRTDSTTNSNATANDEPASTDIIAGEPNPATTQHHHDASVTNGTIWRHSVTHCAEIPREVTLSDNLCDGATWALESGRPTGERGEPGRAFRPGSP